MAVLGQTPGLSARQVAERTAMDKVQVSRAVQSLLESGRLTRDTHSKDGRVSQLSLSPQGLAIYRQLVPVALGLEREFLSVLSLQDRKALDRLLTKLSTAVPKG